MSVERLIDFITTVLGEGVDSSALREIVRENVDEIIRFRQLHTPVLPGGGETVAVANATRVKTAALAFDRVWAPRILTEKVPDDIGVYGGTALELWVQILAMYGESFPERSFAGWGKLYDNDQYGGAESWYRRIAEDLRLERNVAATPVYAATSDLNHEYQPGSATVLLGVLNGLNVVDNSRLSWEQVREFRSDAEMRNHYRRLIHWLDTDMIGKPATLVQDAVAVKLEKYETALRKHGIYTAIGALESVIDPKLVTAVSAAIAGIGIGTGSPEAGIVAGGAIAIGRVTCTVARALVDLHAVRRGDHAEVAYVYELRKQSS